MKKISKPKIKGAKTPYLERTVTRKQFILFCYVPMFTITVLLVGAGLFFRDYYRNNLEDPAIIRHFLVEAVQNLSTEAPLVPRNDRQYIPEVNLSFSRDKAKLAYFYTPKSDDADETVLVTSTAIKNGSSVMMYQYQDAQKLLEAVPDFQHCQRPFILTLTDRAPAFYSEYQKIDTIDSGGRLVYVWKTTEHLCTSADGSNYEDLLATIRTARAY